MTDTSKQISDAVKNGAIASGVDKAYREAIAQALAGEASYAEILKISLNWGSFQDNCGVFYEGLTEEQAATAYDTCYKKMAKALLAFLKKNPNFRQITPFLSTLAGLSRHFESDPQPQGFQAVVNKIPDGKNMVKINDTDQEIHVVIPYDIPLSKKELQAFICQQIEEMFDD